MRRTLNLPGSVVGEVGGKLLAPAASRNAEAILATLLPALPASGRVLELASGTGQHIAALARAAPQLEWQPSEIDATRRASIGGYVAEAALPNLNLPIPLDACAPGWGAQHRPLPAIMLINLLHLISDGEMAVLLDEVAQALVPGGLFAAYGPFLRDGIATSDGDAAFHASLQAQDPAIGYKDLGVVDSVLGALGFTVEALPMPANNIFLLARKGV